MRKYEDIAREARDSQGWTQTQAGARVGLSRRSVTDLETGVKNDLVTFEYAVNVAKHTGRHDLAHAAILQWSGYTVILPPIPAHIDPHVAAVHQITLRERRESDRAFEAAPFFDLSVRRHEATLAACAEQADVVRTEGYKLQAVCERAGITVEDAFRLPSNRLVMIG